MLELHKHPMPCPGGYALDLYCKWNNPAHEWNPVQTRHDEFYAEHGSTCRSEARRIGWIMHRDGTATCPQCAKILGRRARLQSLAE